MDTTTFLKLAQINDFPMEVLDNQMQRDMYKQQLRAELTQFQLRQQQYDLKREELRELELESRHKQKKLQEMHNSNIDTSSKATELVQELKFKIQAHMNELSTQLMSTKDVGERSSELLHQINRHKAEINNLQRQLETSKQKQSTLEQDLNTAHTNATTQEDVQAKRILELKQRKQLLIEEQNQARLQEGQFDQVVLHSREVEQSVSQVEYEIQQAEHKLMLVNLDIQKAQERNLKSKELISDMQMEEKTFQDHIRKQKEQIQDAKRQKESLEQSIEEEISVALQEAQRTKQSNIRNIREIETQLIEQKRQNCLQNDQNLLLLDKVEQMELEVQNLAYRNSLVMQEIQNFVDTDAKTAQMLEPQIIKHARTQKPISTYSPPQLNFQSVPNHTISLRTNMKNQQKVEQSQPLRKTFVDQLAFKENQQPLGSVDQQAFREKLKRQHITTIMAKTAPRQHSQEQSSHKRSQTSSYSFGSSCKDSRIGTAGKNSRSMQRYLNQSINSFSNNNETLLQRLESFYTH